MNKGTPTYTADTYIDVTSQPRAQTVAFFLMDNSIFFTAEPMPEDVWRFYVKEEAFSRLEYIVQQVT